MQEIGMADHQEMIRAAAAAPAAMYNGAAASGSVQASHAGGDWWNTAASLESPGSNSLATGSSITFQEPTGGGGGGVDPACAIAVPKTVAAGFATGAWNQPFLDGSGFHGYMSSSGDQAHVNPPSLMSPSSSNNGMMLQDHHDQNYQFLSSLGFELLSSPASPYSGSRPSSLLRSLTEPSAAVATAKPDSPGFQQYQPAMMNQAPAAASSREPLQFTNNTPFLNPSTGFPAAPPPAQPKPASLVTKRTLEGAGDSSSIITKKADRDTPPPVKKVRTGTPSPLPTFKVRKEKLGDRITALQQLVSPFGKTDTASVLHETIEYIKFLHEQVGAHSAPYLKQNRQQVPHLKSSADKSKDGGGGGGDATAKRDLTGRGLCLVPISSTFAVASESSPVVDFWNPFGAAFR